MEDASGDGWVGRSGHPGFPFLRYASPKIPSKVSAWGELCPTKNMPGSPGLASHSQPPFLPACLLCRKLPVPWLCCLMLRGPGHLPLCSHLPSPSEKQWVFQCQERSCLILGRHPECYSLSPHATPQGPKPGWLANVPAKSHGPGGSMPAPQQPWKGKLHPTQAQPSATQCTRAPSRANTAAGPVFSSGSILRRQRRRRKASVLRYSRWNFQPKREAYSQPSPSASACRCCRREEAAKRERQGRDPKGKPARAT